MIRKGFAPTGIEERPSEEAYDLWSANYDRQPGNLMLDMDEALFPELLGGLLLEGKEVADIGCGTGRHWAKLFQANPQRLTGFDVSGGMLQRLQEKYPEAHTRKITDNRFADVPDGCFDVIVSTLTVAHIQNLDEALKAWSRILKPTADIIITDFHPDVLANGGKRTFRHGNRSMAVENFVHHVHEIEQLLTSQGFKVVQRKERVIDESVKHYYQAQHALPVYEQFTGARMIYGLHLSRG